MAAGAPTPAGRQSHAGNDEHGGSTIFRAKGRRSARRSIRPGDHLCSRLGHGSLRSPLRLLHGGRHDVPAETGAPDARRARPAVFGIRRDGNSKATDYRGRAAGPSRHHGLVPGIVPPSRGGRPQRADADDERNPTRAILRRTRKLRSPAHQRLARYARCQPISGRSRGAEISPRCWPASTPRSARVWR